MAPEEEVIQMEEVEALSRRVKKVLQSCNAKLTNSRAGLQELTSQRNGFAQHLLEAEEDFSRMGHDWRNIEDELKLVRETLLKDVNLSPRARSKLLDSMVAGRNGAAAAKVHSPRSEDLSTAMVSTAATERAVVSASVFVPEEVMGTSIAAILQAAGRSSQTDAILEASRSVNAPDSSRDNRSLTERSTPAMGSTPSGLDRTIDPSIDEVKSRCSALEQQMARLSLRAEPLMGTSPELQRSGRQRARTWAAQPDYMDQHAHGRDAAGHEVLLPAAPTEGSPVIGDALVEDLLPRGHHRDRKLSYDGTLRHVRHHTLPASHGLPPPPSPYSDFGAFSPARMMR